MESSSTLSHAQMLCVLQSVKLSIDSLPEYKEDAYHTSPRFMPSYTNQSERVAAPGRPRSSTRSRIHTPFIRPRSKRLFYLNCQGETCRGREMLEDVIFNLPFARVLASTSPRRWVARTSIRMPQNECDIPCRGENWGFI